MTQEEIVNKLIAAYETPKFESLIERFSSDYSSETINLLFNHVFKDYHSNGQDALNKARIAGSVSQYLESDEFKAVVFWMKGMAYDSLGQYENALSSYQQAEEYYQSVNDKLRVAGLQINQMIILGNMGQYKEAIVLGENALPIVVEDKSKKAQHYLANLQIQFGHCYGYIGKNHEAYNAYEDAGQVLREIGYPENASVIDQNRAIVLRNMQRFDEAHHILQSARKTLSKAGWEQEVARVDLNLGVLSYMRGHFQASLNFFAAAYDGFSRIPQTSEMAIVDLYRSFV
ncbi:MAG: hypothetical protein AAF614_18410, partial [Chloroflexota bacterium]